VSVKVSTVQVEVKTLIEFENNRYINKLKKEKRTKPTV